MIRALLPTSGPFIILLFLLGLSQIKAENLIQPASLTLPGDAAHVFVLHRFDDAKHASTSVSTKDLRQLFTYLQEHHYHVATLDEVVTQIKSGKPFPKKWVLFSIDDSYKSFFTHGLPLFKAFNYPFVLYVYVEAAERHFGDFMNWEQLKEVSRFGALGLHSFGHKHMTRLSRQEIKEDTQKGLDLFIKRMGFRPTSYAYPYGEYDATVQQLIKSFGFALIFNQNMGAVSHLSPIHDLDRIALSGSIHVKPQLRIRYLPAHWNKVAINRSTRLLETIDVSVDPSIKSVEVYVTGDTWHRLKVKKGKIAHRFDLKLRKGRSRIIIKTPDNRWSSKIIIL